jgi:general secretion pathway protein B
MSLILEALKKSEAKRRLGEAPDLETPFAAQRQRRSPLPLIVAAIVIAGGAGWWLSRSPSPPTATVSKPTSTQDKPLAASTPTAPVKQQPVTNPPAATASPAPAAKTMAEMTEIAKWVPVGQGSTRSPGADRKRGDPMAAHPNPVRVLPAPAPPKPTVVVAATNAPNTAAVVTPPPGVKKTESAPAAESKKPELPAVVAAGLGVKKPEPAPEAVLAAGVKKPELAPVAGADSGAQPYYELPFSVRKDLPSLKLSMHVYAPEPSQRFIILNDSRMVEGNSQEELALREIRPDGAVFEFKGQRFFYPRDGL